MAMRFFTFLLILFATPLCAHVTRTDSLEFLVESNLNLNEHDLVIFDYNKTLVIADDALLQSCNTSCLKARMLAHTPTLSAEKINELGSLIMAERKVHLVDPRSSELIKHLQQKGVKVIVVSGIRTGPYGQIQNVVEWHLQEINGLGLDFRSTFPNCNQIAFKKYKKHPAPPLFVDGVLYTGEMPKGEVLSQFFKQTGFKPRRIIFIDDTVANLNSVGKCARKMKIPYLGYCYTKGVDERKTVDEQIAIYQIHNLIENGQWIDDQKAAERMTKWSNTPT